ncbi:MAG: hypothetical protein HYT12_02700 [Candidatus Liptonbacteria bacterium]|nr:hypothetical protein [Candidatus Liptonbacteria bacterium]
MPEINTQNSESFPQEDIERIREKAEQLKKSAEFENAAPRDVVKESIKQVFGLPSQSASTIQAGPINDHDEDKMLPEYMKTEPEEIKEEVEKLIHLALTKSIDESVHEAWRHGSFVVDALHDALTDKVMPQLEMQGASG